MKHLEKEKTLKEATLIFLIKDNKILLPLKTRKIGEGCRNGYGGGIEDGETLLACAVRELKEECGINSLESDLEKMAELYFDNTTAEGLMWNILVHTYLLRNWEGEPTPSEDGAMVDLKWFEFHEIPDKELMPGTYEWLKEIIEGKKVVVRAKHGPRQMSLIDKQTIEEVLGF